MTTDNFLKVLDILEKNIPPNSPSSILRSSFKRTPFTILIATLLSLRTRDEFTAKACRNLFPIANTPQQIVDIPTDRLEEIIKPAGMYRKRARVIQEVSQTLIDRFNGDVPRDRKELISIRWVGDKTANIVLNNAFNIPAIAVDTHVHRVCNLLGFVNTKNDKETLKALERKVPKEYWSGLNFTIVSFGQTICLPRGAKCHICPIAEYCHATKK